MIVQARRSGLVEAEHSVTAVAVDEAGTVVASLGDAIDRDFFARSTYKPFQALVSQRNGSDLNPEQLAVASSSHRGQPVHVAYVRAMLAEGEIAETALMCPPARPGDPAADRLAAARGSTDPDPVFHNCSGKHAAILRACRHRGWDEQYTSPEHRYHGEVTELIEEISGRTVAPAGVDGCGVPTFRTDVRALARCYAALGAGGDLEPIASAMSRFGALTSGDDTAEATIMRWLPAVAKGGAAGCVGVAWLEGGIGFAAKAWSGDTTASIVAVAALMARVGVLDGHPADALREVTAPPVFGGGEPVGTLGLEVR